MFQTVILIIASISFITVIGAAVYEHAAVVPAWSAAVPASLAMFQGEYGLAAQNFWIPIHPVTIVLLTAALILNWKTGRRKFVLTTLSGYLLILTVTAIYFVPEIMAITQTPFSAVVDADLTRRAGLWETLSIGRLIVLIGLAFVLLLGLSKPTKLELPA